MSIFFAKTDFTPIHKSFPWCIAKQIKNNFLNKRFSTTSDWFTKCCAHDPSLKQAIVLIRKEANFPSRKDDPTPLTFKEFVTTIEKFEEFINFPYISEKLAQNPSLNARDLYQKSLERRYEMYKIYFFGCKALWRHIDLAEYYHESNEVISQYKAISQIIEQAAIISHLPDLAQEQEQNL